MSTFLLLLFVGLVILFFYFSGFWYLQYQLGNSAVVDVGWSLSVALVGGVYCYFGTGDAYRRWLVAILIAGWAIRLSLYLFNRWRQHAEDERYTALKEKWGQRAQSRMFRFYQMQALGAFVFTWPLLVVANLEQPIGIMDGVAIGVWMLALVGEALADSQLKRFKEDPGNRGQVCQVGLWQYSRHPNYFFEWLHWWTYVAMAATHPLVMVTLVAPLAMWFFLNRVTGIPATEARAVESRGDRYRQYQQTTNAFFPWFPKQPIEATP